jgi:multiple sugar transport system permease protein
VDRAGDTTVVGRGGWRHVPAALLCLGFLAPLAVVIVGSLRRPGPPPRTVELPARPTLANYAAAFDLAGLPGKAVNSLIVVAVTVPAAVLVASAAGFGIARLPRRSRRVLAAVTIATAMVPTTALLVGRFTVFRAAGLTDTLVPLMAPALLGGSPFFVLLYVWSFRRISTEIFDAARLEGMSELGVYWRVAMPLVRPVSAAIAVATAVVVWGAYLEPLVYVSEPRLFTLPMGVGMLAALDPTNQPLLLAAAVATMAPVVVLMLVVQRRFLTEVPRSTAR